PRIPAETTASLRAFGHGCVWLLGRWNEFQTDLLKYGYWPEAVWPEVVRTLGAHPDFDRIGANPQAFMFALYNFECQPRPDHGQIAKLCAPERRPPELRHLDFPARLPGPERSRQWLLDAIASEIRELQELERTHRTGKDKAARDKALKMALLPRDG